MTGWCDVCGVTQGTSEYDVFNESGAVIVDVCEDCEDRLTADRCAVCGTTVTSGDESIAPHGTPDEGERLCSECRRDIVFGDGGEFR